MTPFTKSFFVFLLSAATASASGPAPLPMAAPAAQKHLSGQDELQSALLQVTSDDEYHIGPSDLLNIKVYQELDMDRELRVSQSGTIPFPLIGAVKVGGLSVANAVALMETKLAEYLVNPQVTILIKEYKDQKVFVLGEVKNSGAYQLPSETPLTVLGAISMAGGFTEIAAPDKTRVLRKQDGKITTIYDDISKITKKADSHDAVTLLPNDIIFVPQTFF